MYLLAVVSDKLSDIRFKTHYNIRIPIFQYLLLLIAGWMGMGLLAVALGIIKNESYGNYAGILAIYSGYTYLMYLLSAAWILVTLFLTLRQLVVWGEKVGT